MTIQHTYVRSILFACLIVLLIFTTSCTAQTITVAPSPIPTNTPLPPTAIPPTPTPTTIPRQPLSADEVKTIAAEFDKISKAHIDAWNKHDTNLMRPLYTDDVRYYEADTTPTVYNAASLISLMSLVLAWHPDIGNRLVDTFISREDGFDIWEIWNYETSTKENPYYQYDRYLLRDGKISSWYLFWGTEAFINLWTPGKTFDQKPLQDYVSAWSSGDPKEVASLYDPNVIRQDALFGENQQGSSAVKEFATNFFSWYPGVSLELLQSFKLDGTGMTGGVYAVHVSDQTGKPCDVRAIILLEISRYKITKEWMFYNADSLIACGWAQ